MNITNICNRIIEYSFYALLFCVPLIFAADTSELFEFNKMWLTFGIAIIIAGTWGVKMVLNKEFRIQQTPLDLPILLFLLSQVISTFFSLDTHTSLWGYYSRFNGGLLSIISYIFLYYAFVSNMTRETAKKSLLVTLASGFVVVLWGLPSHFGYDPTCLIFRGTFDVSCWTEAFQPKIRIFSTLGQPNWLAAYLSILMPIAIGLTIQNSKFKIQNYNSKFKIFNFELQLLTFIFALLTILFYIAILYTDSRSGFLGLLAGGFIFFLFSNQKMFLAKFVFAPLLVLSLLLGTPIDSQLKQVTQRFFPQSSQLVTSNKLQVTSAGTALETGGTESGTIRLIVWRGAIDAWLHNPIFGTGVETFAFAYYRYRPAAHNMTSEWDYLYNKAHNEYLNYLATTGIFGLGSYLLIIGSFLFVSMKNLKSQNSKLKTKSDLVKTTTQNAKLENEKFLALSYNFELCTLSFALIAAYCSILISNFLGFSVVIINIYFFLIPAFVFVLGDMLDPKKVLSSKHQVSWEPWIGIPVILLTTFYLLLTLYRFWDADLSYARGYNLNRAGQYEYAYYDLLDAGEKRPSEPTFIDELSYNTGVLATTLLASKDSVSASDSAKIASYAAKLIENTLLLSNKNTTEHPQNVVFWKTKIRIFNLLGQQDPKFVPLARDAAQKTVELAPTDAKAWYSLGILYGQNNQKQQAINALLRTVQIKPDYRDAYYALALFYHDLATDKNSKVIHPDLQEKANETMQYILDHISSNDAQAKKALETWQKQ